MRNQECKLSFAAFLATGVLMNTTAYAAEWMSEAGVSVGGTYSDNICLSASDTQAKWVATATPDLRVTGEGARSNMDLFVSLQFNSLSNSSLECNDFSGFGEKESPAPLIRFIGDTTLVDDWLYLDVNAFADQNKINQFGVGGDDNLNGTGNSNTTYRYGISPYVARRLTDSIGLLLRYSFDEFYNTDNLVDNSISQSVAMDIGVDPERSRFSAGVSGSYSKVDYDESFGGNTANNELSSARIRAAMQLNSRWQINGAVGEEFNDFVSVFNDTEGAFWDIGILWTPNERISLAVGTGDRFFGSTPRFDLRYRHKRSSVRASYLRAITYEQNLRSSELFFDDVEDPELIFSDPLQDGGAPTTVTNAPILDERFTLVYSFDGRRSTVNFNVSHSEQTRAQDGFQDTFITAAAAYRRQLSRQLSFNSRLIWEDREADENRGVLGRDSNTWRILMGLQQDLGTNTSVFLNYQYSDRRSEFVADEYEENRLTFSFRYQF